MRIGNHVVLGAAGALMLVGSAVAVTGGRQISIQGSFLQSGTGATLRTIEDKERDWLSAADFKVAGVCNGTSIQAAITAAGTTGAVLIPPGCSGTYTNPNDLTVFDMSTPGSLTIRGDTFLRTANNIRFANLFATGSGSGGIAEAYADGPSTGVVIYLGTDITISSAQSISITSGKPLILDMNGRRITFTHTSGAGLTFDQSLVRQLFAIKNGSFYGNGNAGVTGLQLNNVLQGAMSNVVFSSFTGSSQIALGLNNSQDMILDLIQFNDNNGTGTISLDLNNNANANAYHGVAFQACYQPIRIRGSTSGSWFSDCLVQSSLGTNAVVIQATGTDGNISDTRFDRCWFESNGDNTANSSSVYFNTDAGKTISDTTFVNNHFNGNTRGSTGVAFRFSATGTPAGLITTISNYIANYATVQSGLANGSYGWTSINDGDRTATLQASVALAYPGQNKGISFAPTGASKKWLIYGGSPSDNDGKLEFYDQSTTTEILRYGGTWVFPKDINFSSARITYSRTTPTYGASVTINSSLGDVFEIVATNGTAFTVANPLNAAGASQRIVIRIKNSSGGALGALTWDTLYKAPAWAQPANGFSRTAEFYFDGTNWIQMWQSAADVPN